MSPALSTKSHCLDANYYKGNSLEHFLQKKNREIKALSVKNDKSINGIYSIRNGVIQLKNNNLHNMNLPDGDYVFCKLSPRECCRLQTYDERCFDVIHISDTQWYKTFGNGWCVDVIVHILKQIKE